MFPEIFKAALAYAVAVGLAMIVGFFLSARLVFRARDSSSFYRYVLSQTFLLALASTAAGLTEASTGRYGLAFIVATFLLAVVGYYLQRGFVFRVPRKETVEFGPNRAAPDDAKAVRSYVQVQQTGILGWGNSRANFFLAKHSRGGVGQRVLEIGGSSGEHLEYLARMNRISLGEVAAGFSSYTVLDPAARDTRPSLAKALEELGSVTFVRDFAENLPFSDGSFDACWSTCVLAHVDQPDQVLKELRRTTKSGGQILIAMPTDAGFANTTVKKLITFPKLKRNGVPDPKGYYQDSHKNDVRALLALIKKTFNEDEVKLFWWPIGAPSVDLNLLVGAEITVKT